MAQPRYRLGVVWYRLDLRVADHPALVRACQECAAVVPVFLMHEHRMRHPLTAPVRAQFLLEALAALQGNLGQRGGGLIIRRIAAPASPAADPMEHYQQAVCDFLAEVQADVLYCTPQVEPGFLRQDAAIAHWCSERGIAVHAEESITSLPLAELEQPAGGAYRVFTPFWRHALQRWDALAPAPLPPPRLPNGSRELLAGIHSEPLPTLAALGINPGAAAADLRGGEGVARRQLARFLESGVRGYATHRDFLDQQATSRLSAALHVGCVSAREVIASARRRMQEPDAPVDDLVKFIAEVGWRDFAQVLLRHYPETVREPFQPKFRVLEWRDDPELLAAWQAGRMGFPVIDAAQRELVATGLMHNRARMLVASFLTKDLGIHWRRGADHFMSHLLDGNLASNTLGWQWTAGIGTDAAPYFRIFNPITQSVKFDPNGDYIRRWVPELVHLPAGVIHDPARHPSGLDYPPPVIDRAAQREAILARYRQATP